MVSSQSSSAFSSLERRFYTSADIFERELQRLIPRQWMLFGHVSEIPSRGGVAVRDMGTESVIVARDQGGVLRAFFNVCRHRGSQICEDGIHGTNVLLCPYHQWSYALDGRLLKAPDIRDGSEMNYGDYGLRGMPIEIWHGFIFIAFGPEPPRISIADAFAEAEEHVGIFELENLKLATRITYEVQSNWKLIVENFLECYHCRGNHPELCRVTTVPDLDIPDDKPLLPPAVRAETGSLVNARPGPKGVVSATLTGQPACRRFLGRVAHHEPYPNVVVGLYPLSSYLSIFPDHVLTHRMTPVSVERSRIVSEWYVNEDAVEGEDYQLADLVAVWNTTNGQDKILCERNQRGVNSRSYAPGRNSSRQEPWIRDSLTIYAKMMDEAELISRYAQKA